MKGIHFYTVLVLLGLSRVSLQEEDDGVVVEVEPDSEDVPYTPPVPSGNYYLAENFDDLEKFKRKWVLSKAKKEDVDEDLARYDGVWQVEAPKKDNFKSDLGLVLQSKAKHAAIAAKLDKPYHFLNQPLIVQYEVTFQEGQECGGAYIKLLSQGKDTESLSQFVDKTPYTIMFGPDKCGNDVKLHFIFRHKNPKNGTLEEKHSKKPKDRLQHVFDDKKPHLYTLMVQPDNTFKIFVDHKIVNEGSLLEDFEPPVNPPEEIDDPNDVKPATWDEREQIPDPEATKPDDWDEDEPAKIVDTTATKPDDWNEKEEPMIADPDALKPADWDTEIDGEWEPALVENPACVGISGCGKWDPPTIPNPAYKGKWRPPMIDNPNYQGKWKPRKIPNPDHFYDANPFKMTAISAVGFELWSMSPFILFDNIIITDSIETANDYAAKGFDVKIRIIDADAESLYTRVMRSINYKSGWWTVYFIYCLIPLLGYIYYLYRRFQEDSLFTRVLKYSNERPYLYAVYLIIIAIGTTLICVFCCGKEEKLVEDPKKTDSAQPDDTESVATSKKDLDVPEEDLDEDENSYDDELDAEEEEANGLANEEGDSAVRRRKVKPPKV